MKLVKRILVALDLGPDTEALLRVASAVAKRLGSEVSLLHVIPPVSSLPGAQALGDVSTLVESAKKELAGRLAEHRASLSREGVTVAEPTILEGITFDRILDHADNFDANVILVSVGLDESEKRSALGVTTERLCRKSYRPVGVVKPESKGHPATILCPVDLSEPSAVALRNALFLSRAFGSQLTVLHVVPAIATRYGWLPQAQRGLAQPYERALDDFLQKFDFRDVHWSRSVRHGPVVGEIVATVTETGADLIVMGSVGQSGLSRILLGSVAERVLQAAPCSMLLVKGEDTFRLQLTEQVADIESHFRHGAELLRHGFAEEARRQFQHCVSTNVLFTPGWEALADCHDRLGDAARAEECRAQAKLVREALSWRQVEADVRSNHPFWRRGD
jgi:nucleotide-binding universal stress UspA family protein